MSMIDAFRCIARCRSDAAFRGEAYNADGADGFRFWLAVSGYRFLDHELADAFSSLKLRAVDAEEAEELDELKGWFQAMDGSCGRAASASSCAACSASCGPSCSARA